MVNLTCPKCDGDFAVDSFHAKPQGDMAEVRTRGFCCPYCKHDFVRGDKIPSDGVSGGVNIKGTMTVGGDVVGGNLVKYGK